jgi:hypothetical protein
MLNFTSVASTPRLSNSALRAIGSDWRLSVIYKYSSGVPLNVISNADRALNGLEGGAANQRPNQILANVYGPSGPGDRYLNPAAFALPNVGKLGNLRRNSIVGVSNWNFDMALVRTFAFRENQALEFRAEAYNVLNSFRPINPNVQVTSSLFGLIRASRDPRIMQFALKYVF